VRVAVWILAVVFGGCSAPASHRQPIPASRPIAAARPLAEADGANPRLRVQVMEVVRTGPEAVTVKVRFVNPDTTAPVSIGDAFGDVPGDAGSLGGLSLTDPAGQKKVFVLRDDQGRPQCSTGLGAIPPGGQVEAWARFPLPAPGAARVVVEFPGVAPLRDLTVTDGGRGTGSPGPSY
jgi:hypothetical protein